MVIVPLAAIAFSTLAGNRTVSYNGIGFMEVFTRYMRSIFRNKPLVFKSSGYREMTAEDSDSPEDFATEDLIAHYARKRTVGHLLLTLVSMNWRNIIRITGRSVA